MYELKLWPTYFKVSLYSLISIALASFSRIVFSMMEHKVSYFSMELGNLFLICSMRESKSFGINVSSSSVCGLTRTNSSSKLGDLALLQARNSCDSFQTINSHVIREKVCYITVCSVKNVITSSSFFNTGCRTMQFIKRDKP